ncbi:hypothetical protein [Algoriphagus sp. Y33]|uniref:hypothetical protein n=1 Tax=Algoriphagus sp. Y33 TaxID=2772483 RepID=UPI00177CC7EF|nr:hypothetical protein [Algoriphagus sp. Y33]
MKDHYSLLAPYYNSLTKLVFGNELKHAKSHFAENISNKKILIIGGGDGLDYRDFQDQLAGDYWEISGSMLNRAKVNLAESKLTFCLGYFQAKPHKLYDEIWLHFVLDTMQDDEITVLLQEIKKSLTAEGRIHIADFFEPKNAYQRFLNKGMITFFRIAANHRRTGIPDYEQLLFAEHWQKSSEKEFVGGWVKAQLWQSG